MLAPFILVAALLAPQPVAQEEVLQKVGRNSRSVFAFEWGVPGEAISSVGVRFRLERINVDPPAAFAYGVPVDLLMTEGGTFTVPVKDVFKGLAAGDWRVTMRVMNVAGNFSPYTGPPLDLELVVEAPPAATGLRVLEEE